MRILSKLALVLAAGAVVLLVVLYAVRSPSKRPAIAITHPDRPMTIAAQTQFAPVTPFTPIPPAPTPDARPRVVDISTGSVQLAQIPSDFDVVAVLAGGRTLIEREGGPTEVQRAGESRTLTALPDPAFEVSLDGRYVVWLDGDRLRAYDAMASGEPTLGLPAGARFSGSLANGGLLIETEDRSFRSALVDTTGRVVDTLSAAPGQVVASVDGTRLAWASSGETSDQMPDTLFVYDRGTRATGTYPNVSLGDFGVLAWSPDGTEIAFTRRAGFNDSVSVLDLTFGKQRDAYEADAMHQVRNVAFTGAHALRLELIDYVVSNAGIVMTLPIEIPGSLYEVSDTGACGHAVPSAAYDWAACGARCGMPPSDYPVANGIAAWCEGRGTTTCTTQRFTFVDRSRGTAHDLPEAHFGDVEVSPDRTQIAEVIFDDAGNESIRIIRTDDFASRDISLGQTGAGGIAWLPALNEILVFGGHSACVRCD